MPGNTVLAQRSSHQFNTNFILVNQIVYMCLFSVPGVLKTTKSRDGSGILKSGNDKATDNVIMRKVRCLSFGKSTAVK